MLSGRFIQTGLRRGNSRPGLHVRRSWLPTFSTTPHHLSNSGKGLAEPLRRWLRARIRADLYEAFSWRVLALAMANIPRQSISRTCGTRLSGRYTARQHLSPCPERTPARTLIAVTPRHRLLVNLGGNTAPTANGRISKRTWLTRHLSITARHTGTALATRLSNSRVT